MLDQVLPFVTTALLVITFIAMLVLLREQRRYFRLTQERFYLQTERTGKIERRIVSLEQERKVREAINPWRTSDD